MPLEPSSSCPSSSTTDTETRDLLSLPLFWLDSSSLLLGLLGISIVPVFENLGVKYGSPTLAAALANLIPGFTFLIAVIFRMEKVSVRSKVSQAKMIGTILSISGAFIVAFYKGPPILMVPLSQKSNWVLGGVLLTITFLSSSTWSVLQAVVLKDHPDKMTLIFFSCLFGSIQCAAISMIAESDLSAWTLHSRIEVAAVLYGTIMDTVFRNSISAWVLHKKGPVYVALFNPLGTAIAVVLGVVFLSETPHVGRTRNKTLQMARFAYQNRRRQPKRLLSCRVHDGREQ